MKLFGQMGIRGHYGIFAAWKATDVASETAGVTRREAEVLAALGKRLTNAEIAAQLYLSERTVESHVSSLLRKLGAPNRLALGEHASTRPSAAVIPLPAPLELLADPDSYCGRSAERELLRNLWRKATEGVCRVGIVSGEAGIGKSRLVAELANEVHAAGGRVLFGADFEDVQRPYEPFVQAIVTDAATLNDGELLARAGASAEAVARVVPDLAPRLGVAGDALIFDAASAVTDSYAGLRAYFQRAAEAQPLLLVFEDVHWATTTTLGALHYLAAVGGRSPLLVVLTARDTAPDAHDALSSFLGDLSRVPAVERVPLRGLDHQAVADLIEVLGGNADPVAIAAETGGNPLFVREVASAEGETGGSLTALLTRRNLLVDRPTSAVLDVGAALGAEFDAQLVARILDRPLVEVIESLDAGETAGLVARAPASATRFAFMHALFRSVRYNAIPNARRLSLHQQITHALAPLDGDDRVVPELARHAAIAAPLGGAATALDYSIRAATLAEQALAFDEAASHYQRALEVADLLDPPDPHARLGVSIRLGEVMQGGGEPGYATVLADAARVARQLGDAHALAEVGWAMVKYGGPRHPSRDAEFVAIAQEALRELGPAPTAARARTLAAASE
ncbi:MAG: AAA family ATPase, partial [Actinobacteria bacterium]|nr:AAA family ATPase [Actinomycetota bacterium]